MKLSDFTKSFSSLEIVALVIFVIYIIFPFRTPRFLSNTINTPLGLVAVFIVTLYLFFYTNPVLGVVYIFVAYELLRRSALNSESGDAYLVKHTTSEDVRTQQKVKMNPDKTYTLEEEIVSNMAPSQVFNKDMAISSEFQPVAERVVGASMYK